MRLEQKVLIKVRSVVEASVNMSLNTYYFDNIIIALTL